MKYAMLSTLVPKELEESYQKNVKGTMQDAANALQWNLYQGLCENLGEQIHLFNILPVDSFPQYYRYPFVRRSEFGEGNINIGFCNVKMLRNYHKPGKIYKVVRAWCRSDDEPKTLFVYTLAQPLLKAVHKIKNEYPSLHVCAIVADLPNMVNLSSDMSAVQKRYARSQANGAVALLSDVDSFVLLTAQMATYLQIQQPYCVMEGIAADSDDGPSVASDWNQGKTIMYSGTLHKRFGVLHLVDAFKAITDPDFRLIICGVGDSEETIRQASASDPRIIFMGRLPRNEVLRLQQSATVLVNPRLNNEDFTKYSFPSKTMEYLASGVPVVAYKLDGIPDEYDSYIQYPTDNSVETLSKTLETVCGMDPMERQTEGERARRFVLECKNRRVQTRRILDFLSSVQNQ